MPRSSVEMLREAGFVATDVRDIGLNATPDREIFEYARSNDIVVVTRDLGFASTLDYPPGAHSGIIVLRVPTQITTSQLNSILVEAVRDFADRDLARSLVIVERGRTRVRRPDSQ